MNAVVYIGGSILVIEKGVLVEFSDCITGFELIKLQYGFEMCCTLPGGFKVIAHWGSDQACYEWIKSNFPNSVITLGRHTLPDEAIKGVLHES